MEHNDEFMERMAATEEALKAVWPVSPEPSREERDEGSRDRRRTQTPGVFIRRSSDGGFERLLWQPWMVNRPL